MCSSSMRWGFAGKCSSLGLASRGSSCLLFSFRQQLGREILARAEHHPARSGGFERILQVQSRRLVLFLVPIVSLLFPAPLPLVRSGSRSGILPGFRGGGEAGARLRLGLDSFTRPIDQSNNRTIEQSNNRTIEQSTQCDAAYSTALRQRRSDFSPLPTSHVVLRRRFEPLRLQTRA